MDSLLDSQVILAIGAIAVGFFLLRLFFDILWSSLGLIVPIVIILLVLNFVFGISPREVWYEMSNLANDLTQWVRSIV